MFPVSRAWDHTVSVPPRLPYSCRATGSRSVRAVARVGIPFLSKAGRPPFVVETHRGPRLLSSAWLCGSVPVLLSRLVAMCTEGWVAGSCGESVGLLGGPRPFPLCRPILLVRQQRTASRFLHVWTALTVFIIFYFFNAHGCEVVSHGFNLHFSNDQ